MLRSMVRSPRLVLGCHLSIARGLSTAVDEAEELGNNALQLFTRNPMGWKAKPLSPRAAEIFRRSVESASLDYVVVHGLYLANLASPDGLLRRRSVVALSEELTRAQRLGIPYVVTHPGAHMGAGVERAVEWIAVGIGQALDAIHQAEGAVGLLLENTAGAGTAIGGSFVELAAILGRLPERQELAVCLDTCHAFAAGYDMRTPEAASRLLGAFDRDVGLDRLAMIHLNDSRGDLGSRVDRHEHLGRGRIGEAGLAAVIVDPRLRAIPLVLETPKRIDGRDGADEVNLAWVRSIREREEES
jgi:deoxyribonuclease-4